MSVLSPKRVILFVAAILLALPLLAANPSPRLAPRMAFDEESGVGVLFGGRGLTDPATGLEHATDETWTWVRNHWVQLFPDVRPPARSAHSMVYDSAGKRIIVFGGRNESTVLRQRFGIHGDTWAWTNGEWVDLAPGNAPSARFYTGMAYDRDRDRVLLFGGFNYMEDGKTLQTLSDTWEFDGDNWTRVNESGPVAIKPLLVFDAVRHETLMIGTDADAAEVMYRWSTETSKWDSVTPSLLPACANEAQLVYQVHNERPLLTGGLCSDSGLADEVFEWDGSTWVEVDIQDNALITREVDSATAYDTVAQQVVRFGGHNSLQATPDSVTSAYRNRRWRRVTSVGNPQPRSMPLFRRDAERDVVWMFGGLSEDSFGSFIDYLDDIWAYRNGLWTLFKPAVLADTPSQCATPIGALDTDRNVLVVVCDGNTPYEWDGAAWKTFSDLDPSPASRRFAGGVYDQTQKKFVMFGGYDTLGKYRQDTWTWNGTEWTEVKPKTKPPHRAQPVMWYDPLAKKTIMYSGAGTGSIDDHAERFSDMWSFDGTNWTEITKTASPGIRFAPQIAIDPNTGKLLLFGGLRATIDEEDRVTQFYDNDLWMWDGSTSTWTEVQTENAPSPRQNAAFDYDPASGKFVLFGGFAQNFYLSDRWIWDGQTWTVVPDVPSFRRRSARP
jgi:hypothetical protein